MERVFLSKLTDATREEYEQLMVDRLECEDVERFQVYGDGFITGAKLMIEIFTERRAKPPQ